MTKYAEAGRMNAKAEAERPPANSKTTPRSHVVSATTSHCINMAQNQIKKDLRPMAIKITAEVMIT